MIACILTLLMMASSGLAAQVTVRLQVINVSGNPLIIELAQRVKPKDTTWQVINDQAVSPGGKMAFKDQSNKLTHVFRADASEIRLIVKDINNEAIIAKSFDADRLTRKFNRVFFEVDEKNIKAIAKMIGSGKVVAPDEVPGKSWDLGEQESKISQAQASTAQASTPSKSSTPPQPARSDDKENQENKEYKEQRAQPKTRSGAASCTVSL